MELGKKRIVRIFEYLWNWVKSQNCEIWTQNSEKKVRIVRIFEYLWNWVKSQNCENFWIFMELGKQSQNCAFFKIFMELGKQSQNCEIWTQHSEKRVRIVRMFEYLWNWVNKVRIVRYELRILRKKVRIVRIFEYLWNWVKKSELWEFLNIYGIGWKSQNCEIWTQHSERKKGRIVRFLNIYGIG